MVSSLSPGLQHLSVWSVKYCCNFLPMAELWAQRALHIHVSLVRTQTTGTVARPDLLLPKHTLEWVSLYCNSESVMIVMAKGSMRTRYIQRSWLIRLEVLIRLCLSFICRHIFHLSGKNDSLGMMFQLNDLSYSKPEYDLESNLIAQGTSVFR